MLTALFLTAAANEGMWMPDQIPDLAEELKELGIETPPAELMRMDAAPLGAIVDLDHCSGAFVSEDGLIVTAYHCVGDAMRHASKRGENLFETGFHAASRTEERWAGSTFEVKVTEQMEDVTTLVLAGTKKLEGRDRSARIDNNIKALVKRCEKPGLHCEVVSFDYGAEYQLIAQRQFKDVRVVYVPPRAVGYYGGDNDNWQWPRHSGDFAFLRAYADADNHPVAFRSDNKPYKPPAWLKTAATSPDVDEFVMVAGYPAGTYRWLTAAEIDYARDSDYPRRIATLADLLEVMHRFAAQDADTANKVGPRILSLNNQLQYLQGNLAAFGRIKANRRKWEFETDLARWIAEDPTRQAKFGSVLDKMHQLQATEAATAARDHVATEFVRQSNMFEVAHKLYKLAQESKEKDADRDTGYQERDRPDFADWLDAVDEEYEFKVDMVVTRYFLDRMLRLPEDVRVPELDVWFEGQRGKTHDEKLSNAIHKLYTAGSDLADASRRRALMDTSPWYLEASGNPWFDLAKALHPFYERMHDDRGAREAQWAKVRPLYLEAIQDFIPEHRPRYLAKERQVRPGLFYPDANSTLRVTIGKVDGYFPRDGLIAAAKTRLPGIVEKSGDEPYDAPIELVDAIEKGVYGPYESEGSVEVNYLSTADTTLGNSGSATINAKGEFCGVLFDGNYESMATDWMFEEAVTRSIHTDVAFILWYLDAVAGADTLLKELGHTPAIDTDSAASTDAP
ncbi:MAG: S46 family peptidase [Alphaproteobacteria bacterium]|nr:S46 family peptidase [Alphaproteobacteria bacterium]